MLQHYFTTAIRHFWRNRLFSAINILGLSVGISASLVIFLVVHHELGFDRQATDAGRIYRVVLDATFNGTPGYSAAVPAPLAGAVAREMTGIEETVPIMSFQGDGAATVSVAREAAAPRVFKKQAGMVFTTDAYFRLLPYRWLSGSPPASLKNPFSVVLTRSRAAQYFPTMPAEEMIGRSLQYNDDVRAVVTGVVDDYHGQSSFLAEEFISYTSIEKTNLQHAFMMDVWNDWMAYSQLYIKLAPGAPADAAEKQLSTVLKKYNKDSNRNAANTMAFKLQPLSDVHFNTRYAGFNQRVASRSTMYGLIAIGAFLLVLGCINFISLSTAQASNRAKEIGIRKTMGSSKSQLLAQFLAETLFITLMATCLSAALAPVLLSAFKDFIPPGLQADFLQQPYFLAYTVLLVIAVSFLSGFYPALVLSGYQPALVLKNQLLPQTSQTRSAWVRKTLTVSQFVIAQFFVIATLMVSKQIHFALNSDLGFSKDAIISFEAPRDTVKTHVPQLLQQVRNIPGVEVAASGFMPPADNGAAFTNVSFNNGRETVKPEINVQIRWGNPEYLDVFRIPLVAGRNVLPSDTIREVLINETYARALGYPNPAKIIGKGINMHNKTVPIVGVMKDFHDLSMKSTINAVMFGGANGSFFHVKLQSHGGSSDWTTTIDQIHQAFAAMYPAADFNYRFMDESIARFYEAEQHTATLLGWATALAILISCLGLLGLVIYSTHTRTREIGIRKILGASVFQIVSMLSRDFVLLVTLAFMIAAPLAWWAADHWLQNFAYRTSLSWWVFAVSGLAMLAAALLTLSVQTVRTANANPADALRTE